MINSGHPNPGINTLKQARSLQTKKYRYKDRQFLIEGSLPLEEALKSGYHIRKIFYSPRILEKPGIRNLLDKAAEKDDTACFEVTQSDLKNISSEVNPQGICAIADMKSFNAQDLSGNILILDGIQDPGNMGTLIRIAHWFGLGGLILMGGNVDVANPKTVRSSMGSFFFLPYIYCDNLTSSVLGERKCLVSRVHGGLPVREYKKSGLFALVIGNEARGIQSDFSKFDPIDITLPRPGGAESLNAASAAAALLSVIICT